MTQSPLSVSAEPAGIKKIMRMGSLLWHSAQFLQVSLGNQLFHVSLPNIKLAVFCQVDRPGVAS
jgi:hypothetical protein